MNWGKKIPLKLGQITIDSRFSGFEILPNICIITILPEILKICKITFSCCRSHYSWKMRHKRLIWKPILMWVFLLNEYCYFGEERWGKGRKIYLKSKNKLDLYSHSWHLGHENFLFAQIFMPSVSLVPMMIMRIYYQNENEEEEEEE